MAQSGANNTDDILIKAIVANQTYQFVGSVWSAVTTGDNANECVILTRNEPVLS